MATSQFTHQSLFARKPFSPNPNRDRRASEVRRGPYLVGKYETSAHSVLPRDHSSMHDGFIVAGASLQQTPLPEAAEAWLEWHRIRLRGRSEEAYRVYIKALERFFGDMRLCDIGPVELRRYQSERLNNIGQRWARTGSASCINHELNTLQQILKHAGLWSRLAQFYRPLPISKWTPPRVMRPDEAERFYSIANSNADWKLAGLVATLTANTSASGCELRGVQLKHILLDDPDMPQIHIPDDAVKNEYRARVIPLNGEALECVKAALERAVALGSTEPDHYLFPLRTNRVRREGGKAIFRYDPNRPASRSWLRKQWEELRVAAGLPWLRPHDLRHQFITEALEAGMAEHTVMAIAGHVSRAMLEHYSHARLEAKQQAVFALERNRLPRPRSETRFGW